MEVNFLPGSINDSCWIILHRPCVVSGALMDKIEKVEACAGGVLQPLSSGNVKHAVVKPHGRHSSLLPPNVRVCRWRQAVSHFSQEDPWLNLGFVVDCELQTSITLGMTNCFSGVLCLLLSCAFLDINRGKALPILNVWPPLWQLLITVNPDL